MEQQDQNRLFAIGEVSKMFHISISTLRHYEKTGLLMPEYVSPDSGYRYYSAAQFEALNTIRYLRALDMPLSDIREFLNDRDIGCIEEKLQQQKQAVLRKQQELMRIEKKIDHRLNALRDAQNTPLDVISIVRLPECRIVWMERQMEIRDFYDMEEPIRKLVQSDREAVVFLGKIGLGISKEHLLAGKAESYDGIFLILDQEDIYMDSPTELPEMQSVRIRFRGTHMDSAKQYKKLLDFIAEQNLQIAGFSREITLIDFGITNHTEKFVTEICIPVCREPVVDNGT